MLNRVASEYEEKYQGLNEILREYSATSSYSSISLNAEENETYKLKMNCFELKLETYKGPKYINEDNGSVGRDKVRKKKSMNDAETPLKEMKKY